MVQEIVNMIKDDAPSWLILIIIIMSLIEIAPIKINPWNYILKTIGNSFNKDVTTRLKVLEDKLNNLESKLDDHIYESTEQDVRDRRNMILDFANSCMNHVKHTQEDFNFIISECDKYQKYCKKNDIINGVAEDSIFEIRRIHKLCIENNSFLKGGE